MPAHFHARPAWCLRVERTAPWEKSKAMLEAGARLIYYRDVEVRKKLFGRLSR
jgi:hypothetical protein